MTCQTLAEFLTDMYIHKNLSGFATDIGTEISHVGDSLETKLSERVSDKVSVIVVQIKGNSPFRSLFRARKTIY